MEKIGEIARNDALQSFHAFYGKYYDPKTATPEEKKYYKNEYSRIYSYNNRRLNEHISNSEAQRYGYRNAAELRAANKINK